jgi:hypothetical protein
VEAGLAAQKIKKKRYFTGSFGKDAIGTDLTVRKGPCHSKKENWWNQYGPYGSYPLFHPIIRSNYQTIISTSARVPTYDEAVVPRDYRLE